MNPNIEPEQLIYAANYVDPSIPEIEKKNGNGNEILQFDNNRILYGELPNLKSMPISGMLFKLLRF